jgi:hypothetical protein
MRTTQTTGAVLPVSDGSTGPGHLPAPTGVAVGPGAGRTIVDPSMPGVSATSSGGRGVPGDRQQPAAPGGMDVLATLHPRVAIAVARLAEAMNATSESAALLLLTSFAAWCGPRSGVYDLRGGWVSAAPSPVFVFFDTRALAEAQRLISNELDRLEIELRPRITEEWRNADCLGLELAALMDSSGSHRLRLQERREGWVTFMRNPSVQTLRFGIKHAYRGALTLSFDNRDLLDSLCGSDRPARKLMEAVNHAMAGDHAFDSRDADLREDLVGTPSVSPIALSTIALVEHDLGVRLARSASLATRNWWRRCMVWEVESTDAVYSIPQRAPWRNEWADLQRSTTTARLKESGTRYHTPVSGRLIAEWQTALVKRLKSSGAERFLPWALPLPHQLYTVLGVTQGTCYDEAVADARLALRLSEYALTRAAWFQASAVPDLMPAAPVAHQPATTVAASPSPDPEDCVGNSSTARHLAALDAHLVFETRQLCTAPTAPGSARVAA